MEQNPEFQKTKTCDLISNLPQEILHHILSLLPTKDAIQTIVLSKQVYSAWLSLPILDFDQYEIMDSPFGKAMGVFMPTDMFLTYVSSSIRRRLKGFKLQKFRLVADLQDDLELDSRICMATKYAIEHGVQNLQLHLDRNLGKSPPPYDLYMAKSVQVMKLNNLVVQIDYLIKGCPLIKELSFQDCKLPNGIEISSENLKILEIGNCVDVTRVTLKAINLESFSYIGSYNRCKFSINSCKNLKSVLVKKTKLDSSKLLEDLVAELPLLETFEFGFCERFESVKIFNQSLRRLKLVSFGGGVNRIVIHTPKLRKFYYEGNLVTFGYFNSSGIVDAFLNLSRSRFVYDIPLWLEGLNALLRLFGHCKLLRLICHSPEHVNFFEEIRDKFVAPLADLKHLQVEFSSWPRLATYSELVDCFLWQSPHLEELSLNCRDKKICLTFEYHEERENDDIFCCQEHPKTCWKHYLKKVTVESFDGNSKDKEELLKFFRQNAKALDLINA